MSAVTQRDRPPTSLTVSAQTSLLEAGSVARVLRSRRRETVKRIAYGAGFPLLLVLIWQGVNDLGYIDQRFFPPPSKILNVVFSVLSTPVEAAKLGSDVVATLERTIVGYVLGTITGLVAGVLMGIYRPCRYALGPLVYATLPTPKLAIFPLLIVIFGLGNSSKTALVTMGVFYMVCINTQTGVAYANPVYQDLARAFRMPLMTRWFKIVIPSALPSIISGLKLGIGQALILIVSAEFVSSSDGIGYYIWNSWQVLDLPRMFVGLIVVSFVGGAAVLLSNWLEYFLIPWSRR